MSSDHGWVIGVTVAIVFLVISLTICIICWCFKKSPDNDRVSMKPLTSNYSDPSDAITPQRPATGGSVYNYSNPYDKRGSDAGVLAVKQKGPSSRRRNSKEKVSRSRDKHVDNYNYFEPYDTRQSKKGVVAVKSSEKSSSRKNSKSSNNQLQLTEKFPNGNYLNVEISEDNSRNQAKKLENDKVRDVDNSYSDVIYTPDKINSVEKRSDGSRKDIPAPYSVVHLDLLPSK
ncbi:hypothetical protein FSP39_016014 [Pinctada imbricata]|uniref:Uncharacterized protein n=1 Tax=Pinctada imbricata TaxID=66713 RepID=A0AA88YJN5_PINIB|nr:hypothetical protein FSP39_016014 [Pinctada imbricata]